MIKHKWLLFTSAITAAAGAGVATYSLLTEDINESVSFDELKLSTDLSKPNLIEVFADGFDYEWTKDYINASDELGDFNQFANFYTGATSTYIGKTASFGGFKDFSAPAMWEDMNYDGDGKFIDLVARNGKTNDAFVEHLEVADDSFDNEYVFGTFNILEPNSKDVRHSGDALYAEEILNERGTELMNWAGARDEVAGSFGITTTSPEFVQSKAFGNVVEVDENPAKGSRVIFQDNMTHSYHITGPDGKLDSEASVDDSIRASVKYFENIVKTLKETVGSNGVSAYDNSMIVIWGDHANHYQKDATLEDAARTGSHSNLLVKYPNETHAGGINTITDRTVYAPQLNSIINDYFTNQRANPLDLFNETQFDLDRPVLNVASFSLDMQLSKMTNGSMELYGPVMKFGDPSSPTADELFNQVMGGINV